MTIYAFAGSLWDRHRSQRPTSNHLRSEAGAAESEMCAESQSECGHFVALTSCISLFVKKQETRYSNHGQGHEHHLEVLLNRQDPEPPHRPTELESACLQDLRGKARSSVRARESKTMMVWLHH